MVWDPLERMCVPENRGGVPSAPAVPAGVRVVLDIKGDGVLAQLVRQAAANAVIDILS